jgi:hypothetical protein
MILKAVIVTNFAKKYLFLHLLNRLLSFKQYFIVDEVTRTV